MLKGMEKTIKFIILLIFIAYMALWVTAFLYDWMMSMVRPFTRLTY